MPDTSTLLIIAGITIATLIALYHLTTFTIKKAKKTRRQYKMLGARYVLIQRRGALKLASGLVIAGLAGHLLSTRRDSIEAAAAPLIADTNATELTEYLDTPEPPEKISTIKFDQYDYMKNTFVKMDCFDDGTAKIYFTEDHNTDTFTVTHANLDPVEDAFSEWNAPRFSGPVTVPLGRVIRRYGPYPSNAFQLQASASGKLLLFNTDARFQAPSEWYPSSTETRE